jgi:hypothetical protein
MAEKSVNAFPPGHPNRTIGMHKLTILLGLRFDRIGDLDDLKRSILLAKEALAAIPLDHPHRATIMNSLANRLLSRFQRTGDLQDLDQAIVWVNKAVAATPLGHPHRAPRNINLRCCPEDSIAQKTVMIWNSRSCLPSRLWVQLPRTTRIELAT